MEPNFLKNVAKNEPIGTGEADINSPLSFLEWKSRLPSILEKDSLEHYNIYVLNWFAKNKEKPVSRKFVLRQKYLYMLDQLHLFFSTDEKNNWYRQVNLADEKELLLAIPYFAKKLKDIALYYLKLRQKLKHTKIKYNAVGSVGGLEQELYRYLLETFSDNNNELSPTVQSTVPSFSALQNNLSIQIEELYDDKPYFDLSPTQPLSGYFDFLHEVTAGFLSTQGIVLSSSDWLFDSFNITATPDNFASLFSQLTGSLFETPDAALFGEYVQKYIAENKYIIQFVPQLSTVSTVEVSIAAGNNRFFYPQGINNTTFSTSKQLPTIALSSLNIENATAGSSPVDSDTLRIKYGSTTKDAWLRQIDYIDAKQMIKAVLKKDNTTSFIFPFPGYGLSGINLPWTGPSIETTSEYNFLTVELKAAVNQAYWSQEISNDTCDPILLNNSSLVSSGAVANKDPRFADQFYIRPNRSMDTTIPQGELSAAWLYKFTRTALPISVVDTNVFLWPYAKIDPTVAYPSHLEKINFSEGAAPVSIQSLPRSYFIASSSIELADKIYKLERYSDGVEQALECAWLSGSTISVADFNENISSGIQAFANGSINGYKYVNQDGFTALFAAGEAVRFIWTGPNQTSLNAVFGSVSHKKDCPFETDPTAASTLDWERCTCKAVYHAPFGHAYKTFAEGAYFADCIFRVPDQELAEFDFGSWRDTNNRPLSGGGFPEAEFAWYRTPTNYMWGKGRWVSDANLGQTAFSLRTGRAYIYRRANTKVRDTSLPPYAVTYNYFSSNTVWVEAKRFGTGWISTGKTSIMKLRSGEFVKIDKQDRTTIELMSAISIENVSENRGSLWSTYDIVPVECETANATQISWPRIIPPFDNTDPQYPSTAFYELSYIKGWCIERGHDHVIDCYLNSSYIITETVTFPTGSATTGTLTYLNENRSTYNDTITFVPPTTGTYYISVTGVKLDGTFVVYTSSVIPAITCVPQYQLRQYSPIQFTVPAASFLLEYSLNGWNYNTNKIDLIAEGARPYWAVLDVGKTSTTRYKGVYSWGYPDSYVDDYVPNNIPIISPLEITYGSVIEYAHKGYPFVWNQPFNYRKFSGTTQWCVLSVDLNQVSNLSSFYNIKQATADPIAYATTIPSDIVLSNIVEGSPAEIFYYAMNSFTWPITITTVEEQPLPSLSSYFTITTPWENLTNRFNPTIANIPVLEETYSLNDVGGYFLPQNLGASQFINKDFDVYLKNDELTGTQLTESVNIHVGGRGRTKENQNTIFTWKENNQWLKESVTTGDLAGSVKKSLTKTLQTFIPYQSNIDETALGLINNNSRLTPWGGVNNEEWTDKANEQISFTGVRNVEAWADTQIIQQNDKTVDSWATDIYGNQYGLFKSLSGTLSDHSEIFGELWVKTNNQVIKPASMVLSAVFSPFAGITSVDVFSELTNNQIQIVDCYFDTLFIKTPSLVLFAKITYDYDTGAIEMVFDDARWELLDEQNKFEKNWFFPAEKKITTLYTSSIANVTPVLYELDLTTRNYTRVFQYNNNPPIFAPYRSNAGLNYNSALNTFLITYITKTTQENSSDITVVDFYIKKQTVFTLTDIKFYNNQFSQNTAEPPSVLSSYLSCYEVTVGAPFTISISAINSPTQFTLTNYVSAVTVNLVNGYGVFTGTVSSVGMHHLNYKVSNEVGESLYSLSLLASQA